MSVNFSGTIYCPEEQVQRTVTININNTSLDVQITNVQINGSTDITFDVPYPIGPGGGQGATYIANWPDNSPINLQIYVQTSIPGQSLYVVDADGVHNQCYDPQSPSPLTFSAVVMNGPNPIRIVVEDGACQ